MPYCVRCGVKLSPSEARCPLCETPVILSEDDREARFERPFPPRAQPLLDRADRRFLAAILSVLLALPGAVCVVLNLVLPGGGAWSLYVLGALCLLWVAVVFPLLLGRTRLLWFMLADTVALALYLLLIAMLSNGLAWYPTLALPLVLMPGLATLGLAAAIRRKWLQGFGVAAGVFAAIGLLTVGIELVTDLAVTGQVGLAWSWISLVSCLSLSLLLSVLERRTSFRDEIRRRFHL